jgi:isoquinoline 1-oxidoreductase beta subunit
MASTRFSRRAFLRVSAIGGGVLLTAAITGRRRLAESQQAKPEPGLWVRIDPDETITITIAKSEMGQGVRTSLALLVAEELDADWARVKVTQAGYDRRYGNQGTGGSESVRDGWRGLRETGATLRAMLLAAAAADWGVPAGECATEPSHVVHKGSGRRASYGALATKAAAQPVPTGVPLKRKSEYRLLGRDHRGIDVPDILHGRAVFGMDVKVPGMLYAAIERTRAFGGTVKSFDASAARAVPGVRHVVEVKPVGGDVNVHAGVAVVADNTWAAFEGRKKLRVEWDRGPHAAESSAGYAETMRSALDASGKELVNKVGDPDTVLARATRVIRADFDAPFLSHATMEPMNCTAYVQANKAEIWSPTQFPDWATNTAAQAVGLKPEQVTLHVTLMGGGFGRRINPDFTVEAALVSQKAGAPVKVVWTRDDDLGHDFYRPCAMHRIEASLGADGYPEAWRHRMITPAISVTIGDRSGKYGGDESDGAGNMSYRIPNRSSEYTLLDSGVPRGWWRAVSTTHATFAVESFIDELAEAAGKDPVAYRLALIDRIPVDNPAPSKQFPFDPERLKGVLRLAAEKAGWGRTLPAGRGMGVACGIDHLSYAAEVVEVSVEPGRLLVHRVVCAADCGPVINPTGARAQLEGGIVQALSAATKERITIAGGGVEQRNFDTYEILRFADAPAAIETHFVETDTHPTGLGEPAVPPLAAALANAIYRATGKRPRSLPIRL